MLEHLPSLVVATPLLFAFAVFLVGLFRPHLCYPLFLLSLALGCLFSLELLGEVLTRGPVSYPIGGWSPPWGIEYRVDHLNALVIASVSVVALFLGLALKRRIEGEIGPERWPQFYSLLCLQLCGLQGMAITGDVFNLYVLLEIASFSAYALLSMGQKGAEFFAFRYMIFGTIGACCYLLGVGHLYILTGSLNMVDLRGLLEGLYGSRALLVGLLLLVLGAGVKMAAFPLHFWLPDAYEKGPLSATSLLAPLSTKVMAYVLIRILLGVFDGAFSLEAVGEVLGWAALAGVFFSSIMALAQPGLKRALCYLIVSEISLVLMGISSRTPDGLRGAILHLVNDMFMMGCLFSATCALLHQLGHDRIKGLDGLIRRMPLTGMAFIAGGLSVAGIPPFCGFFSKWYLLLGALKAHKWHLVVGILVGSLLNAILVFKILERVIFGSHPNHEAPKREALPLGMAMGVLTFSASVLVLGLWASEIVTKAIDPWIPL